MENHFKYNANINLKNIMTNCEDSIEPSIEDYRITYMSHLQPMSIKWQTKDGKSGNLIVYLDFNSEIVYSSDYSKLESNLGLAIIQVIKQKKSSLVSSTLPNELIDQVINTRNKIFEGRPDAK